MSSQTGYANSNPVARTRGLEMPETLARWLALAAVLFLSSGAAFFRQGATLRNLGRIVSNPFHPRYFYILFVGFMIGSLLFPNGALRRKRLPTRLFWACALFDVYIVLQMLFTQTTDMYWFAYRFEFMVVLPALIVTLGSVSQPAFIFRVLRWVVVGQSLLLIFLFLRPHAIPEMMEFGRPSGLWENPNGAADMIAGALPLITFGLRPIRRNLVYAVTLLGVLATLSREGVLLWVEMFFLSTFFALDKKSGRASFGLGALMAAFIGLGLFSRNVVMSLASVTSTSTARLYTSQDSSTRERAYVLQLGWERFLQKPIFGNGLGYTMHWDYAVSTHNVFVMVLAEHGIVGFVLLLNWIASFLSYVGVTRLWMLGFFMTVGMFSHNLLEGETAPLFALYWLAGFVPVKAAANEAVIPARAGHPLAA